MNSDLELLGLKEAPQHLDEITKHHRTPHIIGEIQAVGGFTAKRLCIGNIFMVAFFELSDHDGHAVASIFFSGGIAEGWLLWNDGEVLK
jgi:hypothetical protein